MQDSICMTGHSPAAIWASEVDRSPLSSSKLFSAALIHQVSHELQAMCFAKTQRSLKAHEHFGDPYVFSYSLVWDFQALKQGSAPSCYFVLHLSVISIFVRCQKSCVHLDEFHVVLCSYSEIGTAEVSPIWPPGVLACSGRNNPATTSQILSLRLLRYFIDQPLLPKHLFNYSSERAATTSIYLPPTHFRTSIFQPQKIEFENVGCKGA